MADAAALALLKKQCSTAKQKFTRKFNILTNVISDEEDISQIEICFDDITHAWQLVEQKHDQYFDSIPENDEASETAEEWIMDIQSKYNSIRQSVIVLRNQVQQQKACVIAKRFYFLEEDKFEKMRKNIEALISGNCLPETLVSERKILTSQFERLTDTHSKYLSIVSDESLSSNLLTKMSDYVVQFNNVKSRIDKYTISSSEKKASQRPLRLEKMPLPKFDGEIRNYPQFKKDFSELVLPNIDARESAFTLRYCLPSEISNYLGCCNDNVADMLKRLDIKYGDPCKIMESIVSEIHRFKKLEADDPKKVIQFVNTLEKAHRDLKSLGLESEIANANTVSLIENKLPQTIQMAWYREIYKEGSNIVKTAKFSHLLKFLKTERDALEYATSDLRKDTKWVSGAYAVSTESENTCVIHFWSSNHSTPDCRTYLNLTLENKYKVLSEKFACYGCLKEGHAMNTCPNKVLCKEGCGKFHHHSLHSVDSLDVKGNTVSNHNSVDNKVLLPIMKILTDSRKCETLSCLWDAGADISFITNSKAKQLNLRGKPVTLNVTTAGGQRNVIESMAYNLKVRDKQNNVQQLNVFGIDKITGSIAEIDLQLIMERFGDIKFDEITRPSGEVDILIGYDYPGWHPIPEKVSGHLVVLNNIFGKCIGGRCPSIIENTEKSFLTATSVNLVQSSGILEQFMSIESLGVQCDPRCGGCKCGSCPIGGKPYTLREERELKMIEANLEFKDTYWITGYPWLIDPELLPDNYGYARKRLESTERRLKQDTIWMAKYVGQIDDMIERGVARKLSCEEINTYAGPIHYIAHNAVFKPESESTPVRIVFDSSHNYKGHSLNSYWAKGPDAYMNNLLTVLLRFRENSVGFVGDIRKMYNSVFTKELEQHVHRFLWRNMETDRPPDIYVITAVNMGDRPSGTIATVALRKTAVMGEQTYPKASEVVVNSTYVDDIVDSADTIEDTHSVTNDITNLLKPGNFQVKGWTISGEQQSMVNLGEENVQKVLGVSWNSYMDTILFKDKLHFSKYLVNQDVRKLGSDKSFIFPTTLTKRSVMSHLNGIYDPLGLLVPFTVKGKLLMRKLWIKDYDWDTPLSQSEYDEWTKFFKEMAQVSCVEFPRSVKPSNVSDELPILIIFSDASREAYGCCSYIRWQLNDGSFQSRLIASKSRVAPLKTTTIVRLELSAAVLAKRMRSFIEDSLRLKFGRVIHIIDSQIVRAMINKVSYGFNTFVATRVGEIQATTEPHEWHWVESKMNVADVITRGATIEELDSSSTWQKGPEFLTLPLEKWPLRDDFTLSEELPETSGYIASLTVESEYKALIEIERFSNFVRLIRVTAKILHLQVANPKYSLLNMRTELTPHCLGNAKLFWEKESQVSIREELRKGICGKGSFRKLNVKEVDGVFVAVGRTEEWNELTYNKKQLVILPGHHRYSELYARHVHETAHLGVNADIAKIRSEYWIINIKRLVKSIRHKCVKCRKQNGKLLEQVMASLPIERLKPAPVWYNMGLDLFGPFHIKGEVNKRTLGKGYAIIFTCLLTRAVFIDIATDYSTDAFLLVFRRFVSLRGYPAKVYSDPGSQLISASKELTTMFNKFDWCKIKDVTACNGLEWKFSPAEAPWYNGCCEALIRSVKKSIYHAIGEQKLTFGEMQTVLYESANVVNERPIGVTPTTIDDGTYLCPNDMLLGRSSNKVPTGDFEFTTSSKRRLYFVQQMIDAVWKKWTCNYFASLLERPKWHHARRNMSIGDVVIIQDKSLRRSQWKLGLITEAFYGSDNKVRHVKVKYINPTSGSPIEVGRPVQRLVIILAVEEYTSEEDTVAS